MQMARFEDRVELVARRRRHVGVDRGHVDEQSRGGEPVVVLGKLAGVFFAVDEIGYSGDQDTPPASPGTRTIRRNTPAGSWQNSA